MIEPGSSPRLAPGSSDQRSRDLNSASHADFTLHIVEQDAITTMHVAGELDLAVQQSVIDAFKMSSSDGRRTCIDLTGISFIDCAGLNALLACRKHSEQHAIDMTIAISPGPVTRLFELVDVCQAFRYEEGNRASKLRSRGTALR